MRMERELERHVEVLRTQCMHKQGRLEELSEELRKLRKAHHTQGRELSLLRRSSEKLLREKQRVDEESQSQSAYIRKLESRLVKCQGQVVDASSTASVLAGASGVSTGTASTAGSNAQHQHPHPHHVVAALRAELRECRECNTELQEKVEDSQHEIRLLTKALDVRAGKLGLEGDFKVLLPPSHIHLVEA